MPESISVGIASYEGEVKNLPKKCLKIIDDEISVLKNTIEWVEKAYVETLRGKCYAVQIGDEEMFDAMVKEQQRLWDQKVNLTFAIDTLERVKDAIKGTS